MRRLLFFTLAVVAGLAVYAQPPERFLSMRPAYPLIIGNANVEGLKYENNGLDLHDIPQDSLPKYEIGQIFSQIVSYTKDGIGFYVKADSLHSANVLYSYAVNEIPNGVIEFNENSGRFKYYPSADDYKSFVVTFSASNGKESISEDVEFNLYAKTLPEETSFQTKGVMPDASDYTIIAETTKSIHLNNEDRNAYSISISGKDIVFDDGIQNKVWGLNGREDIYELNIFAERLIVRSALRFPQTEVSIYAKELLFEDHDTIVACINTTPSSKATLSENDIGSNGANAGNINVYIKTFKANGAKRFVLNGAKGQNSNRECQPGNGGNGGIITASMDLRNYCDFVRGRGGIKYDAAANGSTIAGKIMAVGSMGNDGRFELDNKKFAFLHPFYVSAVMRHANDAFINNYTNEALDVCHEYRTLIDDYAKSDEWNSFSSDEEIQLNNVLTEIEDMLFRLDQGLDYFGNPVGWVPLLSFEVMLANFDNEIDRAIPTLYMYYWLHKVDQTLENKVQTRQFAANEAEREIKKQQDAINSMILEIPIIKDQIAKVEQLIAETEAERDRLYAELLSKAKRSVKKKNRLKKAFSLCSNVISCIPVYGTIASTAINIAMNVGFATNLLNINDHGFPDAVTTIGSVDYADMLSSIKTTFESVRLDSLGSNGNYLKNNYEFINAKIAPLMSSLNNINNDLSKSSTPQSEVEAALDKLLRESPEWQAIVARLEELNSEKIKLTGLCQQTMANIFSTIAQLDDNIIELDALRRDVFSNNSKRDLNAMQYLEKMQQRAKNRLLKYHYYLRKAYEYRLLKPYEGEFNLVSLFERFEKLGDTNLDSIVNEAAYATLGSIFRDIVSEMAEKIIDEYSINYPEQSAPVSIIIPKEMLDIINTSGTLPLNFHEMGIFSPDEENIRIVNLGIQHMETHTDGNVGYSGYLDLKMTHSGTSLFRKNGQLYWFDHMSRSSTSPHTWGVRYDAISNEKTTIQPSAASESLLSSIVGNSNNIMLFSRPSAWSDVSLSKKVHTSGGADIIIDSLVIKLEYDFTHRPSNICNIDISTNDQLLPYIACTVEDINGRSNGNGQLYRSYRKNATPVTFSAVDKYENYHFMNWTDRAGRVVSSKPYLIVSCSNDQFYIANYERRVPILSVPDTIKVSHNGGRHLVYVDNVGSGDLEMDWYVSDSISTWVHLDDIAEGIDKGSFAFTFDPNESRKVRMDSLEIYAPETDTMSKMIYIVQTDNISDKPLDVNGDGSIDVGDVNTILAAILARDDDLTLDVNRDGNIDVGDVNTILSAILRSNSSKVKHSSVIRHILHRTN